MDAKRADERPRALIDFKLAEMVGLLKGVIADGRVCENEARFLLNWFGENPAVAESWPANRLAARLADIRADGQAGEAEQAELRELIAEIVAAIDEGRPSDHGGPPLDDDTASVVFVGRSFAFAGRLATAPKAVCEDMVREMGGEIKSEPFSRLDYLVVGFLGAGPWQDSGHGARIRRALELKAQGTQIISEEHWRRALSAGHDSGD